MFRKTCDAMASTLVICLDLFALSFFSLSMTKTRLILVILSPLALDQLTRLNVEYPMLFELTYKSERQTHITHIKIVICCLKEVICLQMSIVHRHIHKMSALAWTSSASQIPEPCCKIARGHIIAVLFFQPKLCPFFSMLFSVSF